MCEFSKEEWVSGLTRMGVDTMEALKKEVGAALSAVAPRPPPPTHPPAGWCGVCPVLVWHLSRAAPERS
eukprot:SAG25_NODE_1503_length_2882_cov_1.547251_3_plen_69_part_00